MKIYNVLTRKKEKFVSIEPNKVKMYACGITASGDAHIGHAYQAIVFDMIKKYLNYIGYDVTYVRNYTDVDDKIIEKSNKLGISPTIYAEQIMKKTDKELEALKIDPPTIQSKATESIEGMISAIKTLIEKGHAYVTENNDVFFKVETFKNYGKFSNRNMEEVLSGVRIELEEGKIDDKDFALWKSAKEGEIYWESPWGKGRPGWHIECSVMSIKYLGETIDIHGGGKDLLFPHHENEIAQSESLTNKKFSNYWIHNGLIKVNGMKMGKSLGNSILIEDLLKKYNYEVIRMTLLQNHYRSDINIVDGMFELVEKKLYEIYTILNSIEDNNEKNQKIEEEFKEIMNDDFNTALAISNLFNNIKEPKNKNSLIKTYKVLGLMQQNPKQFIKEIQKKYMKNITEEEIKDLIIKRNQYKLEKKYNLSDQIREELLEKGIIIKDSKDKTEWDIKL